MKEKDREELAESFYGVDRILYDRLEKKVGSKQESMGERVGGGVGLGVLAVVPGIGTLFTSMALADHDRAKQELERSFSTEEVKEIVEELGITKINENTELLKKTRRQILDLEKIAKQEIQKKVKEIAEQEEKINENKQTIKNFEAAGEQLKNQLIS